MPAVNMLNEALRLIDFVNSVERVTAEVYPFIQQVEQQLSRDVSNIQLKIEELQDGYRG